MPRRRQRRSLLATVWLDWTPEIGRLFELVPEGWTPPLRVRVSGGLRHVTFTARFRSPQGYPATARVRVNRSEQT